MVWRIRNRKQEAGSELRAGPSETPSPVVGVEDDEVLRLHDLQQAIGAGTRDVAVANDGAGQYWPMARQVAQDVQHPPREFVSEAGAPVIDSTPERPTFNCPPRRWRPCKSSILTHQLLATPHIRHGGARHPRLRPFNPTLTISTLGMPGAQAASAIRAAAVAAMTSRFGFMPVPSWFRRRKRRAAGPHGGCPAGSGLPFRT